MPPAISEAWATSYIQISLAILVFAFGIPVLFYEYIAPEDVRKVARRQERTIYWITLAVLLGIYVLSILLIWFIHPVGKIRSGVIGKWAMAVLLTCNITAVFYMWFLMISSITRKRIANRLGRILRKKLKKNGPLKWDENRLKDLLYLGMHGEKGPEKDIVIREIKAIVDYAMTRDIYSGNDMEMLLRDLAGVVIGKGKMGSEDNYREIGKIATSILNHTINGSRIYGQDKIISKKIIKDIGISAMECGYTNVVSAIVPAIRECGETMVQIGKAAVDNNAPLIAYMVLSELEDEYWTDNVKDTRSSGLDIYYYSMAATIAAEGEEEAAAMVERWRNMDKEWRQRAIEGIGKAIGYQKDILDYKSVIKLKKLYAAVLIM
jgi:hypothetical protein